MIDLLTQRQTKCLNLPTDGLFDISTDYMAYRLICNGIALRGITVRFIFSERSVFKCNISNRYYNFKIHCTVAL